MGICGREVMLRHPLLAHALAVLVGLAVGSAGQYASLALWFRPSGFAIIWIPGGVLLALLLLHPRRYWLAMYAGVCLGGASCIVLAIDSPVAHALVGYGVLCGAVLAVAHLIRAYRKTIFGRVADFLRFFVVSVIAMPAFTGWFTALTYSRAVGDDVIWSRWIVFAPAQAASVLLLTPLLISLRDARTLIHGRTLRALSEPILLILVTLTVMYGLWYGVPADDARLLLMLFVPVPILLLAAMRYGVLGASFCMLLVALPAAGMVVYREGALMSNDVKFNVHLLHLWLISIGFLVYSLTAQAVQERALSRKVQDGDRHSADLLLRLLHSQEEERARISRELHDGVKQQLALLSIKLGILDIQADRGIASSRISIGQLSAALAAVNEDVSRIARDLHPAILDHAGICEAIESLVREMSHLRGTAILFDHDCGGASVAPRAALNMYRIAQESIHNAIRHAHASRIVVSMACSATRVSLLVKDDGVGFDLEAAYSSGRLGLTGMRERALLASGELSVDTSPGLGTSIRVNIPREE